MRLKEADQFGGVYRHQNGGEDPHAAQCGGRQHFFALRRGHQQERHQCQHRRHKGIELITLRQVVGNGGGDIDGHNAHRHIKRGENSDLMFFRRPQPPLGNAPTAVGGKGRIGKHQQE
ncbi:hypothetical protein D3C87_1687700 [compost metagenome]